MTEKVSPIIVDLGKKRRKVVKALKRGEGKLMLEVAQAVDEIRGQLGAESTGKELVPVVLVYEKKASRKRRGFPGGF